MSNLKIWNWQYRIYFEEEVRKEVDDFMGQLCPINREVYEDIINFFSGFFSIDMLLDAIENNPEKEEKYVNKALLHRRDLVYLHPMLNAGCKERAKKVIKKNINLVEYLIACANKTTRRANLQDYFTRLFSKNTYDILKANCVRKTDRVMPLPLTSDIGIKRMREIDRDLKRFRDNSDFDVKYINYDSYGEWRDRDLTGDKSLVVVNNSKFRGDSDRIHTLVHLIYPGFGYLYEMLTRKAYTFDHGALAFINGYGYAIDWLYLGDTYGKIAENNAMFYLNASMYEEEDKRFESICNICKKAGKTEEEIMLMLRYTYGYPGYNEGAFLGALWFKEFLFKSDIPIKEFFKSLAGKDVGELFSTWWKRGNVK